MAFRPSIQGLYVRSPGATVLRMAEAGTHPAQLDALFLTHVHSDHVQRRPWATSS